MFPFLNRWKKRKGKWYEILSPPAVLQGEIFVVKWERDRMHKMLCVGKGRLIRRIFARGSSLLFAEYASGILFAICNMTCLFRFFLFQGGVGDLSYKRLRQAVAEFYVVRQGIFGNVTPTIFKKIFP